MHDQMIKPGQFSVRDWMLYGAIAALKLFLSLAFAGNYGYFRDELYYLACAEHLDWGYVDHPPLSIFILWLTRTLLGEGLIAIRCPAALASAAAIVMTGLIARRMGGGLYAQAIAMLAMLIAPVYLVTGGFFSMNPFDHFFWALAAYVLLVILQGADQRLWLVFGLVCGLGLQNKISMVFFGAGYTAALLLTEHRRHLRSPYFWMAGVLAFLIYLPNILWQIPHDWAMLEFMRNAALYKNSENPLVFLINQVLLMHPFVVAVWVPALFFAFRRPHLQPFRFFAIAFIIILAFLALTSGKSYYMAPAYGPMLAIGALNWEGIRAQRRWAGNFLVGLLIGGGLMLLPYSVPVLSPDAFIKYQAAIGIKAPDSEGSGTNVLPQHFGDRFGWPELVEFIAQHYEALPTEEREQCAILVGNYGEASAMNFWGDRYGLPRAISGHNNYYLWGPGEKEPEVLLVYMSSGEKLSEWFESVEQVGIFTHPYVVPGQLNKPLFLCRGPKTPLSEVWPKLKTYI